MLLKVGSKGPLVGELQLGLKATGHHEGVIDSIFGPVTEESVRSFQRSIPELTVDGIYGPHSKGCLDRALDVLNPLLVDEEQWDEAKGEICPLDVWEAWENQVLPTITGLPVRYGPGRGWYNPELNSMEVTWGIKPNRFDWKGRGGVFPSFHCSSWTNFLAGWLLRVGDEYTGTGNIPPLWDVLLTEGPARYQGIPYRGYYPHVIRFEPDRPYLTSSEIWSRRHELLSFVIFAQSTRRKNGSWKWWHHTGAFTTDHRRSGSPMARIAADGYKSSGGVYSGTPMRNLPISASWAAADDQKHRYRLFCVEGLDSLDGEILKVTIEEGKP